MEPTKYDYEGKSQYIEVLKKVTDTKADEITFVGNGDNDEWVFKSGCKTICINPDNIDSNNKNVWHVEIPYLNNLTQILPEILYDKGAEKRDVRKER